MQPERGERGIPYVAAIVSIKDLSKRAAFCRMTLCCQPSCLRPFRQALLRA
jgi:hypothetical protein